MTLWPIPLIDPKLDTALARAVNAIADDAQEWRKRAEAAEATLAKARELARDAWSSGPDPDGNDPWWQIVKFVTSQPDWDEESADGPQNVVDYVRRLRDQNETARAVIRRLLDGWHYGELLDDEDGGSVWVKDQYSLIGEPAEPDGEPMSDAERALLASIQGDDGE